MMFSTIIPNRRTDVMSYARVSQEIQDVFSL